jgi:hypothetical protein
MHLPMDHTGDSSLGNDILQPITTSLSRQITTSTSGEPVQLANLVNLQRCAVDLFGGSITSAIPKLSVSFN